MTIFLGLDCNCHFFCFPLFRFPSVFIPFSFRIFAVTTRLWGKRKTTPAFILASSPIPMHGAPMHGVNMRIIGKCADNGWMVRDENIIVHFLRCNSFARIFIYVSVWYCIRLMFNMTGCWSNIALHVHTGFINWMIHGLCRQFSFKP